MQTRPGNQADRHQAIRPEPQPAISETLAEPPEFPAPYAINEWYRVGPELHRLGLLTVLDVSALAAYCESYSIWRQAAEMLRVAAKDDPTTNGLLVRGFVRLGDKSVGQGCPVVPSRHSAVRR